MDLPGHLLDDDAERVAGVSVEALDSFPHGYALGLHVAWRDHKAL
jgi:hypothetical protein